MTPLETAIRRALWDADVETMPPWQAWPIRILRLLYAVAQDLSEGHLTLRAMGLVYTTLLSLVPLLAVSFSVLKGFGVHTQIEPVLQNFLSPLGPKGVEITDRIIMFVENVRAGVLGSLGLGFLLYTVVSLIHKVESAFNATWHTTQTRTLGQRFTNYLSVILVGPVLIFLAVGVTASVMSTAIVETLASIEPFGTAISVTSQLLPYLLVITAFTFVYFFVPNARVHARSAVVGGIVAGASWETAGWGFANFVASSTNYTAIYSGFAILIVFMIWLYLSWLILLVGASIAFYHQHPEYVVEERGVPCLSNRLKEKLALLVMFVIGRDHYREAPAWTIDRLARRLGVPVDTLSGVLESLEHRGILTGTAEEPPGYLPRRALETVLIEDVLDAVRAAEEGPFLNPGRLPEEPAVDQALHRVEHAIHQALEDRTLKDLVLSGSPDVGADTRTDP